jgi:hypothetical protein
MALQEISQSVQFVVDQQGKPTAAVVAIETWEAVLSLLEDLSDSKLVRERLAHWRSKEGWTPWEEFEAELDGDAIQTVD